jgi:hypothetical protein
VASFRLFSISSTSGEAIGAAGRKWHARRGPGNFFFWQFPNLPDDAVVF